MPTIQFELDDKGEPVGDLPPELQSILKRVEAEHHKIGYGTGVQQAAKDAKKQIEDAIAFEKARLDAQQPLEKERVARIEADNQTLSARLAELSKESDRTLKTREEAHARELVQSADRIKRRDERIQALTESSIRADAVAAGAREESLDEIAFLVGKFIGFDDDMMPFIKQADGTPQLQAGKPIPISAFVKQYLDTHQHHRKAATGRGGDARGGASLRGQAAPKGNADAIRQQIAEGDRSATTLNKLYEATRKVAS